jgi:GDP/UDP-N,N'-diacetylbacillosamine 2-epimerase (hydrolysing)
MNKRKILYITGTRADYGPMRTVLNAIDDHPDLELDIVATGMHIMPEFGQTIREIRDDGFAPDVLEATYEEDHKESMASFVGKSIGLLVDRMAQSKPDVILLLGDRGEMLAGAVVGAYLAIPVAHLHGGELSSTVDDFARHAITKLAHVHLPATDLSAQRIERMGEESWRIHVVGAPGLDEVLSGDATSPDELFGRLSFEADRPVLLVVQHPVTMEIGQAAEQMEQTLAAASSNGRQIVVIYPNADAGGRKMIEVIHRFEELSSVRIFESMPRRDYLGLLGIASAIVGNSSSGIIEAPSFGLPAINVGSRQDGRERAENVIDVGCDRGDIESAIETALFDEAFRASVEKRENPYGSGGTGLKVAGILGEMPIDDRLLEKRMAY